jgi:hypothetical protein
MEGRTIYGGLHYNIEYYSGEVINLMGLGG